MNWNAWIRTVHRWLSIAFTLGFLINLVASFTVTEPILWVGLLALFPLLGLLGSGLYLFFLPYVARGRRDPAPG